MILEKDGESERAPVRRVRVVLLGLGGRDGAIVSLAPEEAERLLETGRARRVAEDDPRDRPGVEYR